jgi:hypothetical protein
MGIDVTKESIMKPSGYKFQFDLITKDRVFTLYAATKCEKRQWALAINHALTLKC